MPSEVGAAVWIPVAVTVLGGLIAWGWYVFSRARENREDTITKDIERVAKDSKAEIGRVEQHGKDEIARVEKRIDAIAVDQVKLHERTAVAERDIQRAKEDIGDHGTGLRGWLHSLANQVNPVVQWFGLRDRWKDDK